MTAVGLYKLAFPGQHKVSKVQVLCFSSYLALSVPGGSVYSLACRKPKYN